MASSAAVGAAPSAPRVRTELDLPDARERALRVGEVEQAAAEAADGGKLELARADRLA